MRQLTFISVLAGLLVAGCSTRADQIAPASSQASSPAAQSLADTPGPLATSDDLSPPAAAVDDEGLPDECRGGDLDLATLAVRRTCDLSRTVAGPPVGLHVGLDRHQLAAMPGRTTYVRLTLTNTTSAPMTVELDASCGFANVVRTELYSRELRVDEMGTQCEPVVDCSGHAIGVEIDPGQSAFIRVEVDAHAVVSDDSCERFTGRALAPGTYTLEVHTPLAPEPLNATLAVTEAGLPR